MDLLPSVAIQTHERLINTGEMWIYWIENLEMANNSMPLTDDKNIMETESPKMTILKMSRKYLAILGIIPILVTQPHPFNRKISVNYLVYASQFMCHLVFALYEAESFWEYIQSIYLCSISVLGAIVYSMLVFRVSKLFGFIAELENVVNTGKWAKNECH